MTRASKGPGALPHVCPPGARPVAVAGPKRPLRRVLCSRRAIVEARRFLVGTVACTNAWASSSFVPKYERT